MQELTRRKEANAPSSRILACMTVSGVPGRTATVTTSFSSLPSVRPSEFMAALEALRGGKN